MRSLVFLALAASSLDLARGFVCPALPQWSNTSNVTVSDDVALLAALRDQSVARILIVGDVTLGLAWEPLREAPLGLLRNVTVVGATSELDLEYVSLQLSNFTQALYLGDGVTLAFQGVQLEQSGTNSSAQPGLNILAGATDSAGVLVLTDVDIVSQCCVPRNLWARWFWEYSALGAPSAAYTVQTKFVCSHQGNCYQQQVSVLSMCTLAPTAPPPPAPYFQYAVRWSTSLMLCVSMASADCMAQNSTQACLEQCRLSAAPPTPYPAPPFGPPAAPWQLNPDPAWDSSLGGLPTPGPTPAEGSSTSMQTIVLATVVPAVGVVAVVALWVFWRGREARGAAEHGDAPKKRHDKGEDAWCGMFGGSDPETAGSKTASIPSEQGNRSTRAARSGVASSELLSVAESQPSEQGASSVTVTVTGSKGAVSGRSQPARDPGWRSSAAQQQAGDRGSGGFGPRPLQSQSSRGAAGPASSSRAASARSAHGSSNLAAGASSSRDELAAGGGPHEPQPAVTLQRRVQQLTEQRLVCEDEKLVLGQPIGRGAFGTVFRGMWRGLDVAVKTILFSQGDGDKPENAIVEAALASSVVHPNVVSVYHYDMKPVIVNTEDSGDSLQIEFEFRERQNDWKMYIVQELCHSSLAQTLDMGIFHDKATGWPCMDLILSVLLDVATGCAHIHSKNIIWGDLKPENVLLKMDQTKPHGIIAKITDFGMSTTIDPTLSHISNYHKGTPFYAAPEIFLSHQATKTSDVFSYGILVQQLVARRTPYVRTAAGRVEANKEFFRSCPGMPPALSQLMRRCLDQNPKNRPRFDAILVVLQDIYHACMAIHGLAGAPPPRASYSSSPVQAGPGPSPPSLPQEEAHRQRIRISAPGSGHGPMPPLKAAGVADQGVERGSSLEVARPIHRSLLFAEPVSQVSLSAEQPLDGRGGLTGGKAPGASADADASAAAGQAPTGGASRAETQEAAGPSGRRHVQLPMWPMSASAVDGMQALGGRHAAGQGHQQVGASGGPDDPGNNHQPSNPGIAAHAVAAGGLEGSFPSTSREFEAFPNWSTHF